MDLLDIYIREDMIGQVLDRISDAIQAIEKHTYETQDQGSLFGMKSSMSKKL